MTERKDNTEMTDDADDAGFIARIAQPLRAPERLEPGFDARVMSAVRAESRDSAAVLDIQRGWWTRPRTVRVSPLAGLAAAAVIAGLTIVGARGLKSIHSATAGPESAAVAAANTAPAQASVADTVHVVRFIYVDQRAQAVSLVGDFNGWAKGAVHLAPTGKPGVWEVSVELPAGRHEYAFIVSDGREERWDADPFVPEHRDEFGTETSVVTLGAPANPRTTAT